MDKACKPLRLKCVMSSDVGWVANGNPTAPIYLVPTLQRRGFYKLLPYKKGLIDSTVSCLELSPCKVEYATLFHPTAVLNVQNWQYGWITLRFIQAHLQTSHPQQAAKSQAYHPLVKFVENVIQG
jgi:hypothetical protein